MILKSCIVSPLCLSLFLDNVFWQFYTVMMMRKTNILVLKLIANKRLWCILTLQRTKNAKISVEIKLICPGGNINKLVSHDDTTTETLGQYRVSRKEIVSQSQVISNGKDLQNLKTTIIFLAPMSECKYDIIPLLQVCIYVSFAQNNLDFICYNTLSK